jgi:hypothetical protein
LEGKYFSFISYKVYPAYDILAEQRKLFTRAIVWKDISVRWLKSNLQTTVKGRSVNILDPNNPKRRTLLSTAWYILIVILYGFGLYQVFSHSPIDFYRLFEYTFFFVVVLISSILVSNGLFSKPAVRNSPLWIIVAIISWGVFVYPVFTNPPINYSQIFVYTLIFGACIYMQVKGAAAEKKKAKIEDKDS